MDSITVGFSKPKTWKPFSALIMLGFNIPYDHVYIKFHSNTFNRYLVYQASGLMVNFMGKEFTDNNVIVDEFEIPITAENKIAMIQFAIDNAGKPYGIKEAFGMAIVRLVELLFKKKIKNPFGDGGKTYVCSELAGYIMDQYAGAKIPADLDYMTPLDIYNYLIAIKADQTTSQGS